MSKRWLVAVGWLLLAILGCQLTQPQVIPTDVITSYAPTSIPSNTPLPPKPTSTLTPFPFTHTPTTAPPSPTATAIYTSRLTTEARGAATIEIYTNTTRYHIGGATAHEMADEMALVGPIDTLGGYRWFALTEPIFNWRYTCECTDGGCSPEGMIVMLTISYQLPVWSELENTGDEKLAAQWRYFERALVNHEHGHGDLAKDCAGALADAFTTLPAQATCAALDQAVSSASYPVFAACRDAQRHYEDSTNHGRTTGVIWPPEAD